jgi:hypothetical protein
MSAFRVRQLALTVVAAGLVVAAGGLATVSPAAPAFVRGAYIGLTLACVTGNALIALERDRDVGLYEGCEEGQHEPGAVTGEGDGLAVSGVERAIWTHPMALSEPQGVAPGVDGQFHRFPISHGADDGPIEGDLEGAPSNHVQVL